MLCMMQSWVSGPDKEIGNRTEHGEATGCQGPEQRGESREISLYSWCGGVLSFPEMTHRQSSPTVCWWPTAVHWWDSIHMARRTPDWYEWACLPNASHPCIQLGCLLVVPSHGGLYSGFTTKLYFLHSHGASSITFGGEWQNTAEETLSKSWAHTSDILLSSTSPCILPYELGPA